ncbi:uncharacterized protein LOC127806907 isoform X3 [Diospyros lotus]|nr:uncharacterized protein LOC127806907 isoform X3 [Diospyros lotus]XP_052200445.1 uncharacterized protein LOC127806907 isoform X3 [Diospyros lotus]
MGERLAGEVLDVVKRWPEMRKISFVAHSLGGLVARYAIGRLYELFPIVETTGLSGNFSSKEQLNDPIQDPTHCFEARVAGLEPVNFITFATPHLGSRGHKQSSIRCGALKGAFCPVPGLVFWSTLQQQFSFKGQVLGALSDMKADKALGYGFYFALFHHCLVGQRSCGYHLPFLCGVPFLERRAPQTAHLIVGRSGKHLFLTDHDEGKPPLLLRMVNDSDDLKFMSALSSFKRRVAYANANYDYVVGWRTSSIRRQHELPESNLLVKDKKYPHIVYVERETTEKFPNVASSMTGKQKIDLEEEMIRGLTQVPWQRVDISFHESKQRYIAHSTIQVKSYWLNSDGADVVFHMIDNFLL